MLRMNSKKLNIALFLASAPSIFIASISAGGIWTEIVRQFLPCWLSTCDLLLSNDEIYPNGFNYMGIIRPAIALIFSSLSVASAVWLAWRAGSPSSREIELRLDRLESDIKDMRSGTAPNSG